MGKHANLSIFVPHNGCTNRCVFCNQIRISGADKTPTPREVTELCERFLPKSKNGADTEIAFFGGSFTAIERELMDSLLRAALPFVENGRAVGIRLSTRPDAIDDEILDDLKRFKVTSIELGAQSMCDDVLAANKRGHSAQDVISASEMIKQAGISLGLQMMVGMLGETDSEKGALETARSFIAIKPDCVRIYPTLVVENTELCDIYRAGKYTPLSLDRAVEITARLIAMFEKENITVLRAGLHSDESLQKSLVSGPFHPAFGELCRAMIMRDELEKLLENQGEGNCTVCVPRGFMSKAQGQKKSNINYFLKRGICVKIEETDADKPYLKR
ncbi:MAG: radical SAM protein [Oscillospiraceae bacterium]